LQKKYYAAGRILRRWPNNGLEKQTKIVFVKFFVKKRLSNSLDDRERIKTCV
jgi:hypothetical protein